jgi:hypothetical protein
VLGLSDPDRGVLDQTRMLRFRLKLALNINRKWQHIYSDEDFVHMLIHRAPDAKEGNAIIRYLLEQIEKGKC